MQPHWTVRLKRHTSWVFAFLRYPHPSEANYTNGNGNFLHGDGYYMFVPEIFSARKHLYPEFISFTLFVLVSLSVVIFLFSRVFQISVLTTFTGLVALFYFALMVFKLWIVRHSLSSVLIDFSKEEIEAVSDAELPRYTVLVPLLNEAGVMKQVVDAIRALDYPPDKLEVLVTFEAYDKDTLRALYNADPPSYMKPIILPDVPPKTKPKALNVAFLESTGEFVVVYDAEIIPDPDQLKKAYLAFRNHPDIAFLQTKLDHYNAEDNVITKLFNAEFSFYYDLFLPGLQKFGFPIPLSGHSVHFRKTALQRVGAWDPWNVTEDCDIGYAFTVTVLKRGF